MNSNKQLAHMINYSFPDMLAILVGQARDWFKGRSRDAGAVKISCARQVCIVNNVAVFWVL